MKIPFTQLSFKTHQRYNRQINKLLSLGHRIYVTAYLPSASYSVRYKVSLSLLEAQLFNQSVYVLSVTRFKLGYKLPRNLWGQVELDTMRALQADAFIQLLYKLTEERN
jgi:hypothetical protein